MSNHLSPLQLAIAILALWRITHLFWGEDGPGRIFVKLRAAAGAGFWGSLLDCFNCLSLWFSLPLAILLARSLVEGVLLWLALSGAAILLQRATAPAVGPHAPPALWQHHPEPEPEKQNHAVEEPDNVMLR